MRVVVLYLTARLLTKGDRHRERSSWETLLVQQCKVWMINVVVKQFWILACSSL